jgi:aminoglycoside/choline kinase family phosphotransferase
MDAPPELENSAPFLDIAGRLRAAGLHAPEIFEADLERGFLLLEDLGDDLFRDLIDERTVDELFSETFDALAVMARDVDCSGLPDFDPDTLRGELRWFTRYYLDRERGMQWDDDSLQQWERYCTELVDTASQQPQVFVHRDVHSCNLLKLTHNSPGIIDFQDAVRGPMTYDFVSLVWDRYFTWPRLRIEGWMEQFRLLVAPDVAPSTWRRWCDLVGLQRNIKIVGRFALLKHQQGKEGYVEMIPRFYQHVLEVLALYPEFDAIARQLGDPRCAP